MATQRERCRRAEFSQEFSPTTEICSPCCLWRMSTPSGLQYGNNRQWISWYPCHCEFWWVSVRTVCISQRWTGRRERSWEQSPPLWRDTQCWVLLDEGQRSPSKSDSRNSPQCCTLQLCDLEVKINSYYFQLCVSSRVEQLNGQRFRCWWRQPSYVIQTQLKSSKMCLSECLYGMRAPYLYHAITT